MGFPPAADGEGSSDCSVDCVSSGLQDARPDLRRGAVLRHDDPAARPRGRLANARALVAARVGGVRLIDNLALDPSEPGT